MTRPSIALQRDDCFGDALKLSFRAILERAFAIRLSFLSDGDELLALAPISICISSLTDAVDVEAFARTHQGVPAVMNSLLHLIATEHARGSLLTALDHRVPGAGRYDLLLFSDCVIFSAEDPCKASASCGAIATLLLPYPVSNHSRVAQAGHAAAALEAWCDWHGGLGARLPSQVEILDT